MKDLQEIRKDIDVIDKKIVELYKERMKLTSEVASYKIATGKQVLDRERELSKLKVLEQWQTQILPDTVCVSCLSRSCPPAGKNSISC